MDIIRQYYEKSQFVEHHIDSFNYFINQGIKTIVEKEGEIKVVVDDEVKTCLRLGQVRVENPKIVDADRITRLLFPREARERNLTYSGSIVCSVQMDNPVTNQSSYYDYICIGKLPIMVGSDLCNLTKNNLIENIECSRDVGGYYIIKGKERVLVSQFRRQYNKIYVDLERSPHGKDVYTAEIRSINEQESSVLVQLKCFIKTQSMFLSLPYIKTLIPAGLVFKALDVSESEMTMFFRNFAEESSTSQIFANTLKQYLESSSAKEAREEITSRLNDEKRDVDFIINILKSEIFHHFKADSISNQKTAQFLSYMIKKMLYTVSGKRSVDDKHNLAFKRLDNDSSLLSFLFQGLFKQYIKTIGNQLRHKKIYEPEIVLKNNNSITNGLHMAFVTGNWNTLKSCTFTRVGVSQVLTTLNYGAKLSHMRRVMLPVSNKGKNPRIRQIHSSHFGFICPYETPEGETVGIVTNLALSVKVSCHVPKSHTMKVLNMIKSFSQTRRSETATTVFLNGELVGFCDHGFAFYEEFCTYRASDLVDKETSIVWLRNEKEVLIHTDEGRLLRPLYKVQPGNTKPPHLVSWDEMVRAGLVVFRDVEELEHSVVAMTEEDLTKTKCDYLEICLSATMMGVMASVIPLSNHSQSPRNAYQSAMGKQAIGFPCENYMYRYDTTLHVLDMPQQPITHNKMVPVLHFDTMCHGVNPIVLIMTYCGFNQEDSIILNYSSIQRGLFTSTVYKTLVEEEKKRGNSDFETICLPSYEQRNRGYDYSHLNEHGLVWKKNTWLKKDTVIVGKITNKTVRRDEKRVVETKDSSLVIKTGEEGFLDGVLDVVNNEGVRVIKVRVRIPRVPEIGDKFASTTAQKGTCGMVYRQEDMPFDANGVQPDLIINPHAIPSRMTINMLIEMCLNLVGCKMNRKMDATPFEHYDIEAELEQYAEQYNLGDYMTTMYSGFTGQKYPTRMFMAPCYYQRLKHMVVEKIHSRVAGPLDTVTHQPVAGRSRDGGLRFGEMEKDCLFSHGSTRMLKECLFDKSDKYFIPVCLECGNIPNKQDYCSLCENNNITFKNMPYATKLLFQELMSMGIRLKIK